MNFLSDIDNQTKLISFAFFLALFLFSIGVSQFFRQRSERRDLIGKILFLSRSLNPEARIPHLFLTPRPCSINNGAK